MSNQDEDKNIDSGLDQYEIQQLTEINDDIDSGLDQYEIQRHFMEQE